MQVPLSQGKSILAHEWSLVSSLGAVTMEWWQSRNRTSPRSLDPSWKSELLELVSDGAV